MDLESFVHDLHFDIDNVRPPDVTVDWAGAPLCYKLYRGQPVVPLSAEISLTLTGRRAHRSPDLREISNFLWYTFGVTQWTQSVYAGDAKQPSDGLMQMVRRYAPSGGALYPNELYLYLKVDGLATGVYHYDVAHHRLVLLRSGNFDEYLAQALGASCDLPACFGAVLVSTMFAKNFFKYRDFAYRLQGLDTGVVIGQMLEVAKRIGFTAAVCYQFLDGALNYLLGLAAQEESVYAVVPLSIDPLPTWFHDSASEQKRSPGGVTAEQLCAALPPVHHRQYAKPRHEPISARIIAINQAAMLTSMPPARGTAPVTPVHHREGLTVLQLPSVKRMDGDFAATCRSRYSPGLDFVLRGLTQIQVAALLQEATAAFAYHNDLDGTNATAPMRPSLYGCFTGIADIADGAYAYDAAAHALRQMELGDFRERLQLALSMPTVNLFQVPLCLHVVGDSHHLMDCYGYRGYRIAQIEAGMLVQRVVLTAAALGLGGHPLLGYDVATCDDIYRLDDARQTSLIQIPIGAYRTCNRLDGRLHS